MYEIQLYGVGVLLAVGISMVATDTDKPDTWRNSFLTFGFCLLSWVAVGCFLGLIYNELYKRNKKDLIININLEETRNVKDRNRKSRNKKNSPESRRRRDKSYT